MSEYGMKTLTASSPQARAYGAMLKKKKNKREQH